MKINARDCIIEELSRQITEEFLENNHNQGKINFLLSYGLFYKGELVQLMTFGTPRFNKNFQWELLRDCTKKNYLVRGGVSKLWNYFISNNIVHSCICYSYLHNNNLYTSKYVDNCNFRNIKRAKPENKVYFEGIWNGKLKRIDKSILEHHGVNRLLKTNQGKERSNGQILIDLGFEKKIRKRIISASG